MSDRRPGGYGWLRPWPLLIAAIAAFVTGTRLLTDPNDRELAAAALIVVGAICVGAWITMLAAHDYPGAEPLEPLEPPDAPAAGRDGPPNASRPVPPNDQAITGRGPESG